MKNIVIIIAIIIIAIIAFPKKSAKSCDGFEVKNVGCVSIKNSTNWQNAVNTCSKANSHLADRAELSAIYSDKNNNSKIPISGMYWSSNTDDDDNNKAWGLRFDTGTAINGNKSFSLGVLCISK